MKKMMKMMKTMKGTLMKQTWIIATLAMLLTSGYASAQTAATNSSRLPIDSQLTRLEREIARLAKGAGGLVGVSAIHLQTNPRVSLNGSERFPMGSTYKVPIAIQLLTRVDQGELRLDQMIQLQQSDLHPGNGTIVDCSRRFTNSSCSSHVRVIRGRSTTFMFGGNKKSDIFLSVITYFVQHAFSNRSS
jgi:hypothetical protein